MQPERSRNLAIGTYRRRRCRSITCSKPRLVTPPTYRLRSLDLATGRETGRLDFTIAPHFRYCDERQLVLTWDTISREMACWDVPFRPPWLWVLGPPLALGAVWYGLRWWRRRKPKIPQAAPAT